MDILPVANDLRTNVGTHACDTLRIIDYSVIIMYNIRARKQHVQTCRRLLLLYQSLCTYQVCHVFPTPRLWPLSCTWYTTMLLSLAVAMGWWKHPACCVCHLLCGRINKVHTTADREMKSSDVLRCAHTYIPALLYEYGCSGNTRPAFALFVVTRQQYCYCCTVHMCDTRFRAPYSGGRPSYGVPVLYSVT